MIYSENLTISVALKKLESELHSVVGGDGAIYGIRKDLYIPLDVKDIMTL